jgi:UDP-N-acetylglucosamine transferase subunit ALG13
MIFCTVGTTDFDDLLRAVDALAPALGEPVIFQIGQGAYEPQHGQWFRFAPDISSYIREASLVIAHGGFGTTVDVLYAGTPLVSVPNPDRFDKHQEQILRQFGDEGYLVACPHLDDLPAAIQTARTATLRPYQPPQTTLHLEIAQFVSSLR